MCYSGKCYFEGYMGDCEQWSKAYKVAEEVAAKYGIGICAIGGSPDELGSEDSDVFKKAREEFHELYKRGRNEQRD